MFFVQKTIGFIAVMAVLGAVNAATTARPSVTRPAATKRMATMTAYLNGNYASATGTSNATTSSTLLENTKCIDAYMECAKEYCGEEFEDCTTTVLFHAKMPQCLSTLSQCSSAGINSLFGTSNITALGTNPTIVDGEITDYPYPTAGSVLGQMIAGAAIANRLNASQCVSAYTTCLRQSNVCGADFELCTSTKEFKKQRVYCENILARCQNDGVKELFGSINKSDTPSSESRIGIMIDEGAELAAVNAVSTCYKVTDQCILGTCAQNPYRCSAGSAIATINTVADIKNGGANSGEGGTGSAPATGLNTDNNKEILTNNDVAAFLKNSCRDTIGSNKYCYLTAAEMPEVVLSSKNPSAANLNNPTNQDAVFNAMYSKRMNDSMKSKLTELIQQFDTEAKKNCIKTIKTCAMQSCGGGSGAACYTQVFKRDGGDNTINGSNTYSDIESACKAIINTDLNCKYAALNTNSFGAYAYSYSIMDTFSTLFPKYSESNKDNDPIGAVASLNASLSTSYNDAAIDQMRTQCELVAKSCIKSMCGTDYENCFRLRTDATSSLTDTDEEDFDTSMNEMGGVLDNNIVIGLCLDSVQNAQACTEHLKIKTAEVAGANKSGETGWGSNTSVRDAWLGAGDNQEKKVEGATQAKDKDGDFLCTTKDRVGQGKCNTVDDKGNIYSEPVMQTYEYTAATTIFRDVIYGLEIEAQAKYQTKLTKEQRLCVDSNSGGIRGTAAHDGTFQWVKLSGNKKVPSDYSINGLKANDFTSSNELYGSFCRVAVRLSSDDMKVQEALKGKDWTTAYFAVGDAFTCGSWIPAKELENLANAAAEEATDDMEARQKRTRTWTTILGGLATTAGGMFAMDAIQDKGGVLTGKKADDVDKVKNQCKSNLDEALTALRSIKAAASGVTNQAAANQAADYMEAAASVAAKLKLTDEKRAEATTTAAQTLRSATISATSTTETKEVADAITAANSLRSACNLATELSKEKKGWKDNGWTGKTIAGAVTGGLGTIAANRLTKDIQDTTLDKAQKQAYEEWMNAVGNKIKCVIGAEQVGGYGDAISTSVE